MSKNKGEPKEVLGLNRITKKRILELCKKDKLYQTPELNDVLYLHYQGFQSIECLEDYSELKCLWLECNAISEIQGLDNQTKLKCLFLQSNLIKKIENLECCKELDTINLSQNHIRKIENCGFEVLPALNTLNISSNYLKDCEGLKELEYCKNLSVLDLSNNRIDDILVVKIFAKMPELKVLVLQGNPVVSKIPQYRKTLILECKKLTYLDSRPVFPKDRSCAEAWKRGGYEEERKENERWNRMERRKMRDSVNATIRMRNKNRKPEDQLTLLVSSDSEDELDAKKLESQHKLAADVGMDSMWDEVANDSTLETTSSDITVSSSNSANTSDYSNEPDLDGKDATANECLKTFDKENIIFDSNDESIKVCNSDSDTKIVEKNDKENDVEMDSMWDETAYDSTLETTSSDITVSSSNSVNTSDYSNKTDSDKKDVTVNESLKTSDEENICNDSNDESNKVCNLDSDEKIVKPNYTENTVKEGSQKFEVILTKNSEDEFELGEQHTNEDHDLNFKNNTDAVDSIDAICQASFNNSSQIENTLEKPLKRVQLQIETLNGNEDENYEPLQELEEAMNSLIKKIDIGEEKSLKLNSDQKKISSDITSTETQYEHECSAVNHQLKTDFEKLSVNMDNFITQLNKEKEERKEAIEAFFDKKKISKEKINDSNDNETYDNLKELDQWDTETRLNSCKRRYVEEQGEKKKIPKIWINDKPFEEKEELVKEHIIEELKKRKDSEENKVFYFPQEENIKIQPDLKEELKFKGSESPQNSIPQKSESAHSFYSSQEFQQYISNIDSYLKSTNKSNESATKGESSDQEPPSGHSTHKENDTKLLNSKGEAAVAHDFKNTPMDSILLARNTNDAWNSFEKEAKKLKDLLQKLENKNEDLFQELNTDSKNQDELSQGNLKIDLHEQSRGEILSKESIQEINDFQSMENIEKDIDMPPQDIDQSDISKQIAKIQLKEKKICVEERNENFKSTEASVIQQLLEEIIQSLDLKPLKPKSYEFVIDSEKEFSYSATKSQENSMTSNTIPNFLEPFKQFLKNIAIKNRKEMEKESLERPILPYEENKRTPTTDEKKSVCLHELAKQENLKDFNDDNHESLDKILKQYKDEQTKNISGIVDRVYSQKERYNDTLEVVDGKLVVRNKDTDEVKELPQPVGHLSDSDVDYDTAQSEEEEEEEGAWCIKPLIKPSQQKSFLNLKQHYNKIYSLGEENDFNDSDESNDEFFSLDPQAKPNLYKNIDHEFLNKLTLEHITVTDKDEHHIVQCARSYEELKTCLKLRKEERCFTEIENELLEKISESKLANKPENISQILSNNDGITKEENLLLKRMKKINKDKEHSNNANNESNEKQFNQEIDRITLQKTKETVKIFEYENYNESSPSKEQRETSSDLDKSLEFFDDCPSEFSENNVYTFVYEDSEKNNKIKEEKIQPYKEIEYVENEEELNRQDFFEDLLQRKVSFHKVQAEIENLNTTDLHSTTSANSLAGLEKYSEEEKNEIESNIDVEGTEMNQKLEYVQEKECLEEKQCVETSENTGNDNFEVSTVQEFADFENPPNIQHTSVNESLQHKLTPSNIEKQHLDDKTHKSNETLQSTSSTKFENRKELVSQENSLNSANSTPDIRPNSEANFRQFTNELPTHNYKEELSSFEYVADFKGSKEDVQSTNTSDVDILECNLEIFGGNDEIIDTITVNAQVQYDY